ncbi:MAG: GAF domain-containing protein, partial [Anaerolineae bacterium]|nr:GAF domain-containing protein [Anaerolineae bacterium]
VQKLRVLAAQAAVVVENTRLYRNGQSREVELAGLQQITHAIGAFSQESEFFREITTRIAHMMDIAMCGILLYDQQKHRLVAQVPFYGVDDPLIQNYYIPLDPGSVFYETWVEEDYWYTNQVSTNRLAISAGLEPLATALGVRQTMLAVMSVGDRRLGAVQISNKNNDEDFTDKDARLLTIFAAQAAVLVENSRLYRQIQQRADEAERLHNASEGLRRVAELSGMIITADEPFTPVLAEIARLTGSPVVFINLIEQHTSNLVINPRYVFGAELSEPIIHDAYAPGFSKSVAISHRPFVSNDVLHDDQVPEIYRHIAELIGVKRVVMVPLMIGDRSLGELGIANRERRPYDQGDQRMLVAAAVQIAATLDRLTLYQSTDQYLSRRMQELDAIARVSNELTLTLDLDRILDVIRQEASRATGASGSTVALLLPSSQWKTADQPELSRRVGNSRVFDQLAEVERAAATRGVDSVLIEDYSDHADMAPLPANASSAVAAAFMYADEVVGVLHIYHDEPDVFDERAAGFVLTLAAKAALGYGNAVRYQEQMERSRLLQRRVEQLNQIFELGQMIHTNTDPVTLMEAIAYSIQQSVGFDTVLMLLSDEESGTLRRVAHAGLPIDVFESNRSQVIATDQLPLIMQQDYRISESYLFPAENQADWGDHFSLAALDTNYQGRRVIEGQNETDWHNGDMLMVPLHGSSGALVGLIVLDSPQDNQRPNRHTIELLEIFAHQAAATIENNRLYRESINSAEQETQLNEVMKAISSTLDIETILGSVARGALRLIPFRNMTAVLPELDGEGFQVIQIEVQMNDVLDFTRETRDTLEGTALGRSFENGQPYVYHAGSEASAAYGDLQAWYQGGERTTMIVPLLSGGTPIGVWHLGSDLIEAFGFQEFLPLIQRMANLTAVAIQNARLFDEAVNLRVFSESIVESIQQGIIVLDKSLKVISVNHFMKRRYAWNDDAIGKDIFVYRPQLMPILMKHVQHTLQTGEPQERTSHHLTMENKRRTSNFYTYPLGDAANVRGVVLMVEDITERAKLEQDIQERANQLAALTEVSSRITASLDYNEVVALALSEMQRIIAFDTMTFWLRDEDELVLRGAQDYQDDTTPPSVRVQISTHERLNQVVETQQVHTISDLQGWDRLPGEDEAASWMGVPLVNQGEVIGVIAVTRNEVGFYNAQSQQAALAFANQVAVALANAELFREAENRTHRLSLLNRVSVSLGQSLDSEDILEIALREIAQVLNVEKSRGLVFDRDAQVARVIVENPRGDAPPDERVDLKSSPAYDYIRHHVQSLVISDMQNDEIDPAVRAELEPRGMRAYVLIPMAIGGQVIGAFENYVNFVPRRFDLEQLDLGRIIANQAAIAIQNTNLLEQTLARSFELETLLEAAQATSLTLDVDEVFKSVVILMMQALDMDDCALMMWDDIDNVLEVQVDVSRTDDPSRIMEPGTRFNLSSYPAKLAALNQREVLVINEDSREKFPREYTQLQETGDVAQMLVPLVVRDHAIGLMQLELMSEYRMFTHRDVRLAQALGSQAATSIENARLSTETANRVEELYVINDLSQRISATMDIHEMIDVVRDRLPGIVGVEEMYLALYNDETQTITFPLTVRSGESVHVPPRQLGNDEVSFIIRNRRPLSMGSDYFGPDELRRSLGITSSEGDVKSYLGVPLIAGDEVVGVLAVRDSRRTRAFGVNSQGILTTVGAQLGAGIQNARLFEKLQAWNRDLESVIASRTEELEQERDRIDTLFRIASELSRTLDLGRVLNRALEMVATAVDADDGAIMQIDPTTDRLNSRAMLNKRDTLEISINDYQHPAEQIGNWLIQNQEERGILVHDLAQMGQWDLPEWQSAMAVLLEINDDVHGVIVLLGHRKRMFNETHMRVASAAANQIAAAINNSDLYYIIRDQAERLGMLLMTEQQEAEKSNAILEGIADGVMLVDANGKIIRFNSAAERILTLPRRSVVGQPFNKLAGLQGSSASHWRDLISEWQTSSEDRNPEQFYSDRLELDGKVVNVRLSPVHTDDQFLGAVLVFRDITKEVEVDRVKSQFIANVSHELRTPMTSIKGYADLLLLGAAGNLSGQQEQFLNTIKSNADRLSILVNDLLNVSRLDYGNDQLKLETVALGSLLETVINGQEKRAQHEEKALEVHLDVPDDLPSIQADSNKLV